MTKIVLIPLERVSKTHGAKMQYLDKYKKYIFILALI